jgi:hypothetical protein
MKMVSQYGVKLDEEMVMQNCPAGWYVVLWDPVQQGFGEVVMLRTPIACWAYDPRGHKPPVAYGELEMGKWSELNSKLCGCPKRTLGPLAFDAIVTPEGEVIDASGEKFSSWFEWLKNDEIENFKIFISNSGGTLSTSDQVFPQARTVKVFEEPVVGWPRGGDVHPE